MAGYGNRMDTEPDITALEHEHNNTRLGRDDSHPYTDAERNAYGSGATGGAGFGNKSAPDPSLSSESSHDFRFGSRDNTDPYSSPTRHGSGATGGAGWGNKTGSFSESHDSTIGKLMEKAGHAVHNDKLADKGRAKREAQGFGQSETS